MVLDPRKRQKKLERKKAKEKKRVVAERAAFNPLVRFERAAAAPVLDSCVHAMLWEQGMGSLLLSRELANGGVAFAIFLLDTYCLGVKDAMYGVTNRSDYDWRIHSKLVQSGELLRITPEHARKLVEGSVAYARGIGFAPHADYEQARLIFGDLDAAACTEPFEFGKNGKPFYISGPHDSKSKRERIISGLSARLGPSGYHLLLSAGSGLSVETLDDDHEENGVLTFNSTAE